MATVKRGGSPYASGGGGVTLERRVAALYLARLLTGTTAPELDGRRVTRVAIQQGPEHAVDDLLISAARDDGADPLRLAVAVRRAPSFQASDQATEKLVKTFVQDLLADLLAVASPQDPETRLAVCVGGWQPAAKQVATLAAHARSQATADGFFRLVRTPECFERAVVERLGHLLALVTAALTTLGRDASPSAAEAVTWRLLTRLDVLMPRVEPPDETDWTGALIDQLTPWSRTATSDAASSLRDRLESLAAKYAPVAADVDRALLCRDAREAIRDRPPATMRALTATPAPYLEQVRQIAPAVLHDREPELADLARFCAEPDPTQGPYTWWRADAWSGKSALLSWLVLNPPPRTRIVSFFVTARWGAQNDRAAFTDAVADQLAHLLGEQLPTSLTDTTRYSNLLRLLRDAAHLCQDNGERLLLVVDGLDEDRGIDGPAGHSIAGLLPPSPPAGCRIVVASRPNPPLPLDVPDHHPLREARILRPLAPSGHAGGMRTAMERELHQLLAGTPFGQDLPGLLLAAGGGLSARDLAELTGTKEYEVTWRLKTSAARSFSLRPARWNPDADPVYILGHEELRVIATKALGSRHIAEYRAKVHRWAEGYRTGQWPAETPEYLLDGYHRMLMAEGDLGRAADCAADRHRHERLRTVTGGDSAALVETSASLDALKLRADPDLLAMTRLAMHRGTLSDRNRLLPSSLPGLWAKLGQLSRAEAMARSLPERLDRVRALSDVAGILVAAGQHDRARTVADDAVASVTAVFHDLSSTVDPSIPVSMLFVLVPILRQAGAGREASSALAVAETVVRAGGQDGPDHAYLLMQLAQALRENGDHHRALTVLGEAESLVMQASTQSYGRRHTLATLALDLETAGQHERALAAASVAVDDIESVTGRWHENLSVAQYVSVVSNVAEALGRIGKRDEALATLRQAETAVRALVSRGEAGNGWVLARLARAMEGLGDTDRGRALVDHFEATAEAITDRYERMWTLADVARALAGFGDFDRALRVFARAETLACAEDGAAGWGDAVGWAENALIAIAGGLQRSGDVRQACAVLERAEALVRSGPEAAMRRQARGLAITALLWEEFGDRDRAARLAEEVGRLAETAVDLHRRARTLTEVGLALARTDSGRRVPKIAFHVTAMARMAQDEDDRDLLLGLAARAVTAARNFDRVRSVTDLIAAPEQVIHTLAKVADILDLLGEQDRAPSLLRRVDAAVILERAIQRDQSALTSFVRVLVAIGDLDGAQAAAGSTSDPGEQAMARGALVQSLLAAGELERAEALVSTITRPGEAAAGGMLAYAQMQSIARINALSDLARALMAADRPEQAADVVRTAVDLAGPAPNPRLIRDTIPTLARAMAAVGRQDEAEYLADSVADVDIKAQSLIAVATQTSPADTRRLVAEALVLSRWTKPLELLAEIEPHVVIAVADEFMDLVEPALAAMSESAVPKSEA